MASAKRAQTRGFLQILSIHHIYIAQEAAISRLELAP